MWQDVGELAVDLFMPVPGDDLDLDSIFDKKNPNLLRVPLAQPGAFKRRLNQSGWFDEEVVAAGLLTQGKAQSRWCVGDAPSRSRASSASSSPPPAWSPSR